MKELFVIMREVDYAKSKFDYLSGEVKVIVNFNETLLDYYFSKKTDALLFQSEANAVRTIENIIVNYKKIKRDPILADWEYELRVVPFKEEPTPTNKDYLRSLINEELDKREEKCHINITSQNEIEDIIFKLSQFSLLRVSIKEIIQENEATIKHHKSIDEHLTISGTKYIRNEIARLGEINERLTKIINHT